MRFFLTALCVIAGTAQAQFIAEGIDQDSNIGRISVVEIDDDFRRALQVGEQQFFGDGPFRNVNVDAQFAGLYLIRLSTGGTACGAEYVWLDTEGDTPEFSDIFGNCSEKGGGKYRWGKCCSNNGRRITRRWICEICL